MFFILGYGIFRNFGIWDIGIYFGIRVKLILGYGIFWTVYFGIWDIAYPPNQASSEFSRVRSTSEKFYVFNSRDEIYLVFTEKKRKFSFYLIQYTGIFQFTRQAVKMQKPNVFENTNIFGTSLFLTF